MMMCSKSWSVPESEREPAFLGRVKKSVIGGVQERHGVSRAYWGCIEGESHTTILHYRFFFARRLENLRPFARTRHFVTTTNCHYDNLSRQNFDYTTICHAAKLSHGQFVTMRILIIRQFITLPSCHMDNLSQEFNRVIIFSATVC